MTKPGFVWRPCPSCAKRRIRTDGPVCGVCAWKQKPPELCKGPCGKTRHIRSVGLCNSCYNSSRIKKVPCCDCGAAFRLSKRETGRPDRCRSCSLKKRRAEKLPLQGSMRKRLRAYGLTVDEYFAMIEAQGHQCALCLDPISTGAKSTHVDHCHTTGRVRGVLCIRCNMGLGFFRDRPEVLIKAAAYLEAGT